MLVVRKRRRLNKDEVDRIVAKGQRVVPLPDKEYRLPGLKNKVRYLAQYAGRSEAGHRRALANLQRRTVTPMSNLPAKAPLVPDNIPQPNVPTAIPDIPHADLMKGKALRSVLSKEEFDLYVEEWISWFKDHPEYDRKEDLVDIDRICMEVVNQYRINMLTMQFQNRDYSLPLNQSVNRQQKARENLEARRVDRMRPKGPKNMTVNNFGGAPISVMVGQITMQEREQRAIEQQKATFDFLEGPSTASVPAMTEADVIDVQAVEQE